eukprot:5021261-Amphidinium_carterae.1
MIGSILLVSITTLVMTMCTSMRLHQQLRKPQMMDASTQTDQGDATRVAGSREVYVYYEGRRYHSTAECSAVTG